MESLERQLQVHIAMMTAIGGLLLASGDVGVILPTIAVLAAIVSHLLVDRWKLIALPTPLAYVGMGLVAAYCMAQFFFAQENTQLMVVAQLLVLVLVVLLFQKKSVRVYEQIGVFCLLELIVAAVFNSALLFGLLLVPFALVGLRALVLLQAVSTAHTGDPKEVGVAVTSSPRSAQQIGRRSRRLPRYGITVLTPSVLLVAAFFFYALPRSRGAGEGGRVGGKMTTGFDDSLTLDQVGELLKNRELVMRVQLSERDTRRIYKVEDPIYLRGQALETYDYDGGAGRWDSDDATAPMLGNLLPEEFVPRREASRVLYDNVRVGIDLQPLTNTRTLFAVIPYYSLKPLRDIEHRPGKWILRRDAERATSGRFRYEFGTHAFSNGRQTNFTRLAATMETYVYASQRHEQSVLQRALTQFDPVAMPTIAAEAKRIASELGDRADSPYSVAQAIESYLAESGQFEYTLSLTEERNRKIDPIEEFVADYRRGHCQYFASAMVMMLRSLDIPARIVVGYRSDEYNPMGNHYLVRQLHAHAWVEVLLREDQIPLTSGLGGQPSQGPVLARFDPTPSDAEDQIDQAGRVEHFYDFAQSLWNNYVLDMNGDRQSQTLFGNDDGAGVSSAYSRMILQIRQTIARINSGELGAGALANGKLFSWRGAVLGIILTLILFGLYQLGLPEWARGRLRRTKQAQVTQQRSAIAFYQRMCDRLEQAGLHKRPGQTAQEFATSVAHTLAQNQSPDAVPVTTTGAWRNMLQSIVQPYYQLRYGGRPPLTADEQSAIEASLNQLDSQLASLPDSHSQTPPPSQSS